MKPKIPLSSTTPNSPTVQLDKAFPNANTPGDGRSPKLFENPLQVIDVQTSTTPHSPTVKLDEAFPNAVTPGDGRSPTLFENPFRVTEAQTAMVAVLTEDIGGGATAV